MSSDELRAAALALPVEDRASLVHDLIRSLDENVDSNLEAAWLQEVTRRASEVADGSVQVVDWDTARERIAQRLRARRNATEDTSSR
jgi:putative addiction module component (TIGR02574 family)